MASAYVGTTVMPPLFGLLSQGLGLWIMPLFLAVLLLVMWLSYERVLIKTK